MKRKLVTGMLFLLIVSALIACSSKSTTNESNNQNAGSSSNTGESTDKNVNFTIPVLPDDLPAFEATYAEFQEEHPNIQIKFISFPANQYYEKLRTQLSGGVEYDLFGGILDKMVDTGIIEPLNDYIKSNNTDVSGYGELYKEMTINGNIYGLPFRKSPWMLFYNKDIFDAAGVEYPSADMTWDEFRALAAKVTSGSGADKTYGAFLHTWAQTWYMSAVQAGATVIDKDLSPFVDALQLRLDMEADGSIMPWAESKSTGAHYNAIFQSGTVAMSIIGDWHVAQLRKAEDEGKMSFKWDVVPIPHPKGVESNTSLATPVALMINKNSKHKEEAYKVVEFFTGSKGAQVFASKGFVTGYTDDAVKQAFYGDGSRQPEHLNYFYETSEYAEYPMLPGVKTIVVDGIFLQEGELVFIGDKTPQEAVAAMEERVQKEWASIYEEQFSIK
ncbi:ABC transporter substrate-binding protein [Paenibacillus pinisoli]|nr:sugar ABC transporter substrate-binding protein [Paenibacillus pinisoli]